jgi:MOSC domain-containing protein YiiM
MFGENLRLAGIDVSHAIIGERWKLGLDVEVEVTSPRTPCATFQRRMGEPHWVKRFAAAGRVGAYLRVVRTGSIEAGNHVHRIFVPTHGVSIAKWFSDPSVADMDSLRDADADGQIRLQPEYHDDFAKMRRRLGV